MSTNASPTAVASGPVHITRLNPVRSGTLRASLNAGCSQSAPAASLTWSQTPSPGARSFSVFKNGGASGLNDWNACACASQVKSALNWPPI